MKTMRMVRLVGIVSVWAVGACALVACSPKADIPAGAPAPVGSAPAATAAPAAPAAPLPTVTVTSVKAQKRDFPITLRGTGAVTPITSVDVRAQVNSTISIVHFKEGQFVHAGQLLFTLDARNDEANVAKARAQLAKDNASLADAKRQLERSKQLFSQNFISQGAVDTSQAQVDAISATILADQAAIDSARVALSYGQIKAPNSGRAGAVNVSTGSTVEANKTTLVTITQLDPIAVGFSLPQRNLADALVALKNGGSSVQATLADGGGVFNGRLQFVDNAVDPTSGTVKAKAVFQNKDNKLWPGAFVDISQTVSTLKDVVVVPLAAVVQSARGTVVYVVQDGKAVLRPVKVVYSEGADAALDGIQAGDIVVLDGKQNVRPNSPVVEKANEPKPGKADKSKSPKQ